MVVALPFIPLISPSETTTICKSHRWLLYHNYHNAPVMKVALWSLRCESATKTWKMLVVAMLERRQSPGAPTWLAKVWASDASKDPVGFVGALPQLRKKQMLPHRSVILPITVAIRAAMLRPHWMDLGVKSWTTDILPMKSRALVAAIPIVPVVLAAMAPQIFWLAMVSMDMDVTSALAFREPR